MREIPVTEVKARLLQYRDDVERGTTFRLTRHGRVIARLVPENQARKENALEAANAIRALGRRNIGTTASEILSAKEEGRRV